MDQFGSCSECLNKQCFIHQYCSPLWLSKVNEFKTVLAYEKGDYIFREGDRIFGLHFILQGKVKIISTGLNEKEQVVRLATTGHVLGHRGEGNETYPVGAIALAPTHTCFLDNELMYELFMNNPKLTFAVMLFYSFELRKMEIRERHLAQMTLRERVADALLYLYDIFGVKESDKSINVNLTRQELADIAGVRVEQVIRELTEFEREHLICKKGKSLELTHLEGLLQVVASHNLHRYASELNRFDPHRFYLS